jgi:hypothetical protein
VASSSSSSSSSSSAAVAAAAAAADPLAQLGSESAASKSSKHLIAELLVDLCARFPVPAKSLISKYGLYAHMLSLCRYKEQHMVLVGVKLFRICVGLKDPFIIS